MTAGRRRVKQEGRFQGAQCRPPLNETVQGAEQPGEQGKGGRPREALRNPPRKKAAPQRSQGVKATAEAARRLLPGWRLEREKEEQEKEGAGGWTRLPAAAAAATWSNRAGRRAPPGVEATARGSGKDLRLLRSSRCGRRRPERLRSAPRSAATSPRRARLAPSARGRARAHALTHTHTHTLTHVCTPPLPSCCCCRCSQRRSGPRGPAAPALNI